MDVREIRRRNLQSLVQKHGGQKALSNLVPPTSSGHISQMFNGTRGMGSAVARRIEKCLNRPHGWMDQPHDQETALAVRQIWEQGGLESLDPHPDKVDRELFERIYETVDVSRFVERLDELSKFLVILEIYLGQRSLKTRITPATIESAMNKLKLLSGP
ncbi:MAG: hypothetical protein HQL82_13440 [Magnetococcales bacterium]|nr:hypothetical protein [Magnetococcales bacterium]